MDNSKRARSEKSRTQPRDRAYVAPADLQSALRRIRQAACRDKELRFTSLWHHVYNVDRLRKAYFKLKRKAAAGVDHMTWRQYGEDLEDNLRDLSQRLQSGAYRAKPVRRVYIPKADGRQRHRITGERMDRLAAKWLPPVRTLHPYPEQRLRVTT